MSIIIAKIENNSCLFRSDTKVSILNGDHSVTGDNKIRLTPNEGVLKIHILNPNICIAFAGTVEVCAEIIHQLCNKSKSNETDIFQFIQKKLIEKSDDSEFIVAFIGRNGSPRMFRVNIDTIEEGRSFWIGNKEAFNEFQSYFLREQENGEQSDLRRAAIAFRSLIENSSIATIGDFIVGAYFNHENQSFFYEESISVIGGYKVQHVEANVTATLDEGTVEEGAFSVSTLISNRKDKHVVCLFFQKGKLAYLYIPISKNNKTVTPSIFEDVTIEELKNLVYAKFEIPLYGYVMTSGKLQIVR